ncbi:MAG: hypothetical protein IPF96_12290 [Rhodobacter sp.]|nr:hypothetical protein [Rhodobacter sp.]
MTTNGCASTHQAPIPKKADEDADSGRPAARGVEGADGGQKRADAEDLGKAEVPDHRQVQVQHIADTAQQRDQRPDRDRDHPDRRRDHRPQRLEQRAAVGQEAGVEIGLRHLAQEVGRDVVAIADDRGGDQRGADCGNHREDQRQFRNPGAVVEQARADAEADRKNAADRHPDGTAPENPDHHKGIGQGDPEQLFRHHPCQREKGGHDQRDGQHDRPRRGKRQHGQDRQHTRDTSQDGTLAVVPVKHRRQCHQQQAEGEDRAPVQLGRVEAEDVLVPALADHRPAGAFGAATGRDDLAAFAQGAGVPDRMPPPGEGGPDQPDHGGGAQDGQNRVQPAGEQVFMQPFHRPRFTVRRFLRGQHLGPDEGAVHLSAPSA